MSNSDCVIIIPAKNEENHIRQVIEGVFTSFSPAEIVVINDHSSDYTPEIALLAGATVLSHSSSLGYAATLQTGYKYAQEKGYQYLIQLDGDGQHLPSSIPDIYQALAQKEADLVVGNRFLHSASYTTSFARSLGMKLFGLVVKKLTKLNLSDTTSGFQGMSRPLFLWYCQEHFPRDFPDADILIRTHFHGFRIKEIPAEMRIPDGNISMHRGILRPSYYVCKMWLSIIQTLFCYQVWNRENS